MQNDPTAHPTVTIPANATDRQLLAAVHKWARTVPEGSCLPRYERGLWTGLWYSSPPNGGRIEIRWCDPSGDLLVIQRESRFDDEVRVTLPREALTVRRAVDLLVTLDILPAEFSSTYAAGRESLTDTESGQVCPNCAPGYDCERGIYTLLVGVS